MVCYCATHLVGGDSPLSDSPLSVQIWQRNNASTEQTGLGDNVQLSCGKQNRQIQINLWKSRFCFGKPAVNADGDNYA